MDREVQMAIKLDERLRDSFHAAARSQHRLAAQVIRDLMRRYVAEIDDPAHAKGASLPSVKTP